MFRDKLFCGSEKWCVVKIYICWWKLFYFRAHCHFCFVLFFEQHCTYRSPHLLWQVNGRCRCTEISILRTILKFAKTSKPPFRHEKLCVYAEPLHAPVLPVPAHSKAVRPNTVQTGQGCIVNSHRKVLGPDTRKNWNETFFERNFIHLCSTRHTDL